MKENKENTIKNYIDNLLIINLYILFFGALFFITGVILSINGNTIIYNFFQKLWYPVFIPALSLFFTAVLIEAIINKLQNKD